MECLGYIHRHLGHQSNTIACYRQAAVLYRGVGNRNEYAETLLNLGQGARKNWQPALHILDELDHLDVDLVRAKLARAELPSPRR